MLGGHVRNTLRSTGLMTVIALTGCSVEYYDRQGQDIQRLGDAINHCRGYTEFVLPPAARISVDRLSTREARDHYDVYFNVSDGTHHGYVQCQVNLRGKITHHVVRDFRRRSRSFGDFSF